MDSIKVRCLPVAPLATGAALVVSALVHAMKSGWAGVLEGSFLWTTVITALVFGVAVGMLIPSSLEVTKEELVARYLFRARHYALGDMKRVDFEGLNLHATLRDGKQVSVRNVMLPPKKFDRLEDALRTAMLGGKG